MMRPAGRVLQRSFTNARFLATTASSSSFHSKNQEQNYSRQDSQGFNYKGFAGLGLLAAAGITVSETEDKQIVDKTQPKLWHGLKLELYMYYGCPFCARLEAYLKYRQIPYTRIEVNAMTKAQVKEVGKPFGNYKKVPFMIATVESTGERLGLKDSSRIVSAFESFLISKDQTVDRLKFLFDKCYAEFETNIDPKTGEELKTPVKDFLNIWMVMRDQQEAEDQPIKGDIKREMKWRQWVQDKLLHTIAPNLYRNYGESIASTKHFISISPKYGNTWTGTTINYLGGPAMYHIGQIIVKRHKDILTSSLKDPRQDLYRFCDEWVSNLPNKNGFMSGTSEPNLADLEAFGTLSILEGTPVFPDMIANSSIKKWYYLMRETVGNKQTVKPDSGCFISADP